MPIVIWPSSVIDAVMFAHGVKFLDAVKLLAAQAGIQLPTATSGHELRRLRRQQKKRLGERRELNADCDDNEQEERALRLECCDLIHFSDDIVALPGEWSEEQWRLAAMAHELLPDLVAEYTLLSFGPLEKRMKYVLASELDRMAIVRRVRNAGGVIAHDDEQDHFVKTLA